MTKEEMAKAYAEGFIEEYREIAYDAFLCGYGAKCSLEIPKDLGEAAKEYAKAYTDNDNGNGGDDWEDDIKITFQAGAKWQKEQDRLEIANIKAKLWQDGFDDCRKQMMKDAVECKVFNYGLPQYPGIFTTLPDGEYNEGDKVRVIIVKED